MIGRPSPSASAREAKLCRMSWMRTSWSPVRTRMASHDPSMSVMCVPGLAPGMTQRLPGLGGRASRTRTVDRRADFDADLHANVLDSRDYEGSTFDAGQHAKQHT